MMGRDRRTWRLTARALSICLLLAAFVFVSASLAQVSEPEVDDETCLGCHEDRAATLMNTPHRPASDLESSATGVACASCHEGASEHIEDPSIETIGNPARQSDQTVYMVCENCHTAHRELDNIGFDPHLDFGLNCASCHSIHGGQPGLVVDEQFKFCGECHAALASEWYRTSVHPVADGQVTCISCHDFTGSLQPNFGSGPQENCYSCHPMQAGPFPWPHEATSSYLPQGGGCTSCHMPHGSANDRLLTQPGDGLCTQCHGTPPAHRTAHGGIGEQYMCAECHDAVHGSDYNKNLLDPDLAAKIGGSQPSCWCHGVD